MCGIGQTADGQVQCMETFALEANVPGGPYAASRARRLVRDELSGRVPEDVLPDIALLVTELVANGVRHGGAHAGTVLHLVLEARPPALHVEVHNPDHVRGVVGRRAPDMTGAGGLGLEIVERLASRWGVREGQSTAVWFELDCPPDELL
jgi:anti-sigma regulatory factor (Ser/Thr protein kinase)